MDLSNDPQPDFYNITDVSLNGVEIPVVGLADPDYSYHLSLKVLPDGTVVFENGFAFELLLLLQYALKFKYKAIKGEGWPDQFPNGSWAGIGRQVLDNEAEMSIAQSTILSERVKVFFHLLPTTKGSLVASFRQPPSNAVRNILTASFPISLWIVLLLSAFFFIFTLKIMKFIKARYKEVVDNIGIEEDLENWPDSYFAQEAVYWVLVTFCQRNSVGSPSSLPMRIIYISLTITSLVAYVAFSAALVSNLAIQIYPIQSFADLIQSKLPIFGDSSVPFTNDLIKNLINQRLQSNGKEAVGTLADSYFVTTNSGINKIMNEYVAYITFDDGLNTVYRRMNLTDQYLCKNIFKLAVTGTSFPSGMFVRRGSILRKVMNPKIAMLHERGFVKRLHIKWLWEIFPKCLHSSGHSKASLELNDVYTAFVILFVGFLGSSFAISVELICFYLSARSYFNCRRCISSNISVSQDERW